MAELIGRADRSRQKAKRSVSICAASSTPTSTTSPTHRHADGANPRARRSRIVHGLRLETRDTRLLRADPDAVRAPAPATGDKRW